MSALSTTFVVLLSLLGILCRSEKAPFRSRKSPRETIYNYDVVYPQVTSYNDDKAHPVSLIISLTSDSKTYKIHLKRNDILIHPDFTSVYYEGTEMVKQGHPNCFYQGKVEGHSNWKAVFSTCQGFRGFFGDLENKESLFHLEPFHDTSEITDPHILYSDTEHKFTNNLACGTTHNVTHRNFISSGISAKYRLKRQSGNTYNIVELLVVNDNYQYLAYNSNITAVVLRAISIINHIDMLYQTLNVRVVIVHSLTWTARQEIAFNSNSQELLSLFRTYHSNTPSFRNIIHDSAMLLTGIDIDGNTVGIAYLGTMCNYDSSVGVTQDTRSSLESVSTIAAHELGHTFGLSHDDSASCNCPDPDGGCIMNAVSSFPPATQWSQCSRNELSTSFDNDLNRCLGNSPTTIVGEAKCGNGIKEPGEICDCGSVQECTDPCCNATTCSLHSNAQCASGECCESCKFKTYGTVCRSPRSECDIIEYCTGDNTDCPTDVTRQNGISCDSDSGYCYDGVCASHDLQCAFFFNSSSRGSNDLCYSHFNVMGVGFGHCGSNGANFISCPIQDVQCGSLQCTGGGSLISNNVNTANAYIIYTRYISGYQCRSFSTFATADEVSPGLVMDGTKCGNNSLCMSQRCVDVSTVVNVPCPVGSNGLQCSGNGICNNLNNCSCNIGFAGRDCSQTVVISTSTSVDGGLIGGLVILFIALAIIAVISVVIVVVVVVIKRKRSFSRPLPSPKTKYSRGSVSGNKITFNASKDDLLMSEAERANLSKPSSQHTTAYVPPTYKPYEGPTVTVNNNNYSQRPFADRPDNPRRPPPPPVNRAPPPAPPTNRPNPSNNPRRPPPPPVNRPSPPSKPVKPPPPVNKPSVAPTKPQVAPKPGKVQVQWPPPSSDPPQTAVRPNKPMVPPRK